MKGAVGFVISILLQKFTRESSSVFFKSVKIRQNCGHEFVAPLLAHPVDLQSALCDMRTTAAGCLRARNATQRNATGSATATRRHEQAPYCRSHLPASDGDRVGAVAVFDMVSPRGGSVAEWLACWTQAQKGPGSK